jgi:tryptophan 2,3-dioxygenase
LLYITTYKNEKQLIPLAKLLDQMVAMEEAMLMWKARHVRMVERMIGRRIGTGGSSGVDYLESTVKYRVLEDLWEVRSFNIRPSSMTTYVKLSKEW